MKICGVYFIHYEIFLSILYVIKNKQTYFRVQKTSHSYNKAIFICFTDQAQSHQ